MSALLALLRGVPRSVWLFLAILTAIAILPWDPQGPFDARDWTRLAGVHLDYPWSGVLMEPLLAPSHVLMGAPDFRIALLSTSVWIVVLALMAGAASSQGLGRRVARALLWAAFASGGVLLYVLFMALLHLPGWRLAVDDPTLLVADLQTHTFGSHDGLATADQNLAWHQARGYNLIGITEHNDPRGSFAMQARAHALPGAPAVVAGVEVSDERDKFLLGIGIDPSHGVLPWKGNQVEYARKFVADVHAQGGAVIALAWLLEVQDVRRLAAAGIDAIELVNTGHPDIPDEVRDTMLDMAGPQKLVVVASTDWHGWSGFTRTWTLMALPNAAALSSQQKARALVDSVRARDAAAFTPVAAGYMGPPGMLRAVFAPWAEAVRYAAELSPARVLSWWAWAVFLAVAAAALKARGARGGWVLGAGLVALTGIALAARAWELRSFRMAGAPHAYAMEMGTPALLVALAAVAVAAWLLWQEGRRLKGRSAPLPHAQAKRAP